MVNELRPRVAILEDDADIQEALAALLHEIGLAVTVCHPTPYAAECIAAAQPEVIILDVRMAAVDGLAVFQQLRANAATAHVPVIFFTATEQRISSRIPQYEEQGAFFVIKPNIPQLRARIEQILHLDT